MSKFIVEGRTSLHGTVKMSTAKNAILPIIAATLLTKETCLLQDLSRLDDVSSMLEVIGSVGANIEVKEGGAAICCDHIAENEVPYELTHKLRASFLVMGPILSRAGKLKISLPGGCAIGVRPIDLHLKGLSAMGACVEFEHGYVKATADRLRGCSIYLDFPSVGATENLMMAACLAEGITTLENAAEEPEIVDLANFLTKMGAEITGAGTDTIQIHGMQSLHGAIHRPIPDRIEAGSFMVAAAITGGDVLIDGVVPEHVKALTAKLKEMGAEITEYETSIHVRGPRDLKPVDIITMPYPGFPTDMQSQIMTLLTVATGTSIVNETVFENRFMHVDELNRMGARIKVEGKSAIIEGIDFLMGTKVRATDLRAGAALLIAGLAAKGTTEISDIYHIDRGYDRIEEKLGKLGAKILRCED